MHRTDDDENKPVWPTRPFTLSGVRDVETYNRGPPSWNLSGVVSTIHHSEVMRLSTSLSLLS
jgi:hypothetical protein